MILLNVRAISAKSKQIIYLVFVNCMRNLYMKEGRGNRVNTTANDKRNWGIYFGRGKQGRSLGNQSWEDNFPCRATLGEKRVGFLFFNMLYKLVQKHLSNSMTRKKNTFICLAVTDKYLLAVLNLAKSLIQ